LQSFSLSFIYFDLNLSQAMNLSAEIENICSFLFISFAHQESQLLAVTSVENTKKVFCSQICSFNI